MNSVVHFEIHAAEPERAAKFYRVLFGWEIHEWTIPDVEIPEENRYWMINTGADEAPGINGGIMVRRGAAPAEEQPVNAYVCTIGVASIDDHVAKAEAAGATITVPKMAIKGMGWIVYCKDTEGNIFGMMQEDEKAA